MQSEMEVKSLSRLTPFLNVFNELHRLSPLYVCRNFEGWEVDSESHRQQISRIRKSNSPVIISMAAGNFVGTPRLLR